MIATARATYLVFIMLSALGNAVHSYPDPVGMGIAGLLPIALALAMFLLERITGNGWLNTVRVGGAAVVALGTSVASFLHLFELAREHGEPLITAALTPLAFDGIVLVASLSIIVAGNTQRNASQPRTAPNVTPRVGTLRWVFPAPYSTILPLVPLHPALIRGRERPVPVVPEIEPLHIVAPFLSPDARLVLDRFGYDLPSVRTLKLDQMWGTTRATNALAELRNAA